MAITPQILQWVQATYPSPRVNPEWLQECLAYIQTDLSIPFPPHGPLQPVLDALNTQILLSDLVDSMVPGTGLPGNVGVLNDVKLGVGAGQGGGVLVQIIAITEIGSSAFNLLGVLKAREERGVILDPDALPNENVDGDDEGPLQKYPRGMLRLELSDGTTRVKAIEYRPIPELELGVTPLGYKVDPLPCSFSLITTLLTTPYSSS
jgi:RecQ-mediated genome instability protein 1